MSALHANSPASIHYRIEPKDLHAHLFSITLTVAHPEKEQILALPVWIPGSYLVREFSKNLQNLTAHQGKRKLALTQKDKHRWQALCDPAQPLTLHYEVCAYDNSVRTAWLDSSRGFFNGTSLCLQVCGQEAQPHTLEVVSNAATADWSVATGLPALKLNKKGFGTYAAAHYDELVDCPVELGAFWVGHFVACGIPHRFVVAGAAASFDGQRLLADTQKICETAIQFWHGKHPQKAPHKNYLFMLNAVGDGYGGLEHRNSTALICGRQDLPRQGVDKTSEGYTTLLGLISHEYFHTWNVKRLRPAEFERYDYSQENYTQLLWFFEGFTSYYDDILLRRAGLLDDSGYLKLLNKTINQVLQTPGRQVQTVAQASFDAWVKYYRQDPHTPNTTVSYYTKGALVALCLDLTLRQEGKTTLDDVMRSLWQHSKGGPIREEDIAEQLHKLSGRSFAPELRQWVHGTKDLPVRKLLEAQGAQIHDDPAQSAQQWGLRVDEARGTVVVKSVLRGGAAEAAGFSPGDEWLGLELPGAAREAWKLSKLDDIALYAGKHKRMTALVARDQRLLRLPLTLPGAITTWRIAQRQPENIQRWLAA